ncbi:YcaO-like family protein [Rossellomorea sp. AcN35-11]|nr:YcaO-like family protein [Rossellomorea aquimaris]WJV29882.1 YcaO-like family protein [Rossellomorea sp. AcN35-11]
MYKVPFNSTPFLIKELQVFRSIFRGNHVKVNVKAANEGGIEGSSTSFSINNSIKAAFGESLERTSLYLNSGNIKSNYLLGYDFLTDRVKKVHLERILLCHHSPVFKGQELDFNDSCGVASHTDSFKAIEAAFLEFIERQSFVYNWLTKSKGTRIDNKKTMRSHRLKHLMERSQNYIDEVHSFNISLSNEVNVILSLGIGEKHVGIGLSGGWTEEEALYGSLKEMYQFFGFQRTKYEIELTDSNSFGRLLYSNNIDEEDPHYYAKSFLSNFGAHKLQEEYSYLFESEYSDLNSPKAPENMSELTKRVKATSEELDMDTILTFIPSKIQGTPIKIVKFLTERGFPHMKTESIEPDKIFLLKNKSTPNKGRLLPFP